MFKEGGIVLEEMIEEPTILDSDTNKQMSNWTSDVLVIPCLSW